ncbi:MAG: 50S ribosomal protein L22 [Chitinophagales bacterium]|jgi:large subunit ribosomal protein L22|nr:50S ribosomal protein L22 [Bacteroidota bacterium]MBP9878692.1 50S ribosomal protein L22 [Chitinophagales bacterium]MBK9555589.1 50S ribosomal protein L22 [Bacteroidota bacterium]MBL0279913.1 50S ribosomal protein L22 [Bacteroidota bacterium]HRF76524.1 50S ribosomal protein L22 [Chitinophagales bacterium]
MEAVAKLINNPRTNNNAGSPRKTRYVVDLIRGLDIDKALNVLRFTDKAAATPIEKLLRSAIKNWEQKFEMDAADSSLYVKECFVDGGKTMRRFQPAPHGRAYRIRKRTNHITIKVASRTATNNANNETKE